VVTTHVGPNADEAVREAWTLLDAGRPYDALALLSDRGEGRSPTFETEMVHLRHTAAVEALTRGRSAPSAPPAPSTWPPVVADLVSPPAPGRPPEVEANALDAATLSAAIVHHGCLLVRGLLPEHRAVGLTASVDAAFAAHDAWAANDLTAVEDGPWFTPFFPRAHHRLPATRRRWVRDGGAVWAADSPRVLSEILDAVAGTRAPAAIAGHLGEPPMMSVNKSTMRRVDRAEPTWHQDGSFLGEEVRSVDLWIALSACGGESNTPGLAIVPRRIDEILPTGTHGAMFPHSIGPALVEEWADDHPIVRPVFAPGDALLFDERFLHCTGTTPHTTDRRYALELWYFSPSAYPADLVPLLV